MIIDHRRRLVFTLVYIFFKEVTQFSKVLLFPIKKEVRDCTLSWSRKLSDRFKAWGGGGYFGNFWVGMCRWDPGPITELVQLTYNRASSAEFCYPILE